MLQSKSSPPLVFENVLGKINLKEFQDFIRKYASKDENFKTEFELWFADKDDRIDVGKKYADLIEKLIGNYTNGDFIKYRDTCNLSNDIDKLLTTGNDFVHKKNFSDAFAIAKTVLKKMMNVITYCDDSGGSIGSTIDFSIQLIDSIIEASEAAIELKEQVFDFLQTELNNKLYFDYGDFGYDLFRIFQKVALKLNRTEAFLNFIDSQFSKLTGKYDDYRKDFFHTQKIEFLKATGKTEEVEKLIQQNLDIVEVRQGEVNNAIEKNDFILAKKLISDGIKIAQKKDHPGTVSQWEKEFLRIAVLEKDIQTIRYYTKHFAFNGYFNKDYYSQWKNTYSVSEWKEVIEKYIVEKVKKITEEHEKKKNNTWHSANPLLLGSVAPVYIEEGYWDRLLKLVMVENKLETVWQYHDYLIKRYPLELLEIYLPAFERKGDSASNRSEYADLVLRMKKVLKDIPQGKEKIIAVARNLKQKYPRRPAMVDELNKILK